MKKENIEKLINEAFADVPYPGNNQIIDFRCDWDLEAAEVYRYFGKKHWREIDWKILRDAGTDAIFFFTPQAYRFFLPAYQIACMEHNDEMGVIPEYFLGTLESHPLHPHSVFRKLFLERCDKLTGKQKRVVRLFL